MREIYRLTDESRHVLTGNCGKIAAEMDVSDKYLYAMLAESETDVYAPFRRLFRAAANACAPVEIWLNDLIAIQKRAANACAGAIVKMQSALREKIRVDAATTEKLIAALDDGELDKRECHELLAAVYKIRGNADRLESLLHHRLAELVGEDGKTNIGRVQ